MWHPHFGRFVCSPLPFRPVSLCVSRFPLQNTYTAYGGGRVRITVPGGTLLINGSVTADGQASPSAGVGGGSGGTIILTAATVGGTGTVSASGDAGVVSGGWCVCVCVPVRACACV